MKGKLDMDLHNQEGPSLQDSSADRMGPARPLNSRLGQAAKSPFQGVNDFDCAVVPEVRPRQCRGSFVTDHAKTEPAKGAQSRCRGTSGNEHSTKQAPLMGVPPIALE